MWRVRHWLLGHQFVLVTDNAQGWASGGLLSSVCRIFKTRSGVWVIKTPVGMMPFSELKDGCWVPLTFTGKTPDSVAAKGETV